MIQWSLQQSCATTHDLFWPDLCICQQFLSLLPAVHPKDQSKTYQHVCPLVVRSFIISSQMNDKTRIMTFMLMRIVHFCQYIELVSINSDTDSATDSRARAWHLLFLLFIPVCHVLFLVCLSGFRLSKCQFCSCPYWPVITVSSRMLISNDEQSICFSGNNFSSPRLTKRVRRCLVCKAELTPHKLFHFILPQTCPSHPLDRIFSFLSSYLLRISFLTVLLSGDAVIRSETWRHRQSGHSLFCRLCDGVPIRTTHFAFTALLLSSLNRILSLRLFEWQEWRPILVGRKSNGNNSEICISVDYLHNELNVADVCQHDFGLIPFALYKFVCLKKTNQMNHLKWLSLKYLRFQSFQPC